MKHLTYGNLLHKMKRIKYKRNYKRSKLQKIMKLINVMNQAKMRL